MTEPRVVHTQFLTLEQKYAAEKKMLGELVILAFLYLLPIVLLYAVMKHDIKLNGPIGPWYWFKYGLPIMFLTASLLTSMALLMRFVKAISILKDWPRIWKLFQKSEALNTVCIGLVMSSGFSILAFAKPKPDVLFALGLVQCLITVVIYGYAAVFFNRGRLSKESK